MRRRDNKLQYFFILDVEVFFIFAYDEDIYKTNIFSLKYSDSRKI